MPEQSPLPFDGFPSLVAGCLLVAVGYGVPFGLGILGTTLAAPGAIACLAGALLVLAGIRDLDSRFRASVRRLGPLALGGFALAVAGTSTIATDAASGAGPPSIPSPLVALVGVATTLAVVSLVVTGSAELAARTDWLDRSATGDARSADGATRGSTAGDSRRAYPDAKSRPASRSEPAANGSDRSRASRERRSDRDRDDPTTELESER